jgi:hypothetical protein
VAPKEREIIPAAKGIRKVFMCAGAVRRIALENPPCQSRDA